MKILFLILTLLLFTLSAPVYAQTSEAGETIEHAQSAKLNEAHVSVNGLVCDFCARALEKRSANKTKYPLLMSIWIQRL
jgi:hypothetical protein